MLVYERINQEFTTGHCRALGCSTTPLPTGRALGMAVSCSRVPPPAILPEPGTCHACASTHHDSMRHPFPTGNRDSRWLLVLHAARQRPGSCSYMACDQAGHTSQPAAGPHGILLPPALLLRSAHPLAAQTAWQFHNTATPHRPPRNAGAAVGWCCLDAVGNGSRELVAAAAVGAGTRTGAAAATAPCSAAAV
jgi:hypothetical protein